ncbi:Trichodiene oxygenase [Cyphellophora attinorum]|uniref:Trichodiene oxygenase n=1 Tax=Cyphellophora attinorum TaxID=1664694 RepID=A0A0N1HIA3_9EURO|nr:Trichodiene oxygenase [Phialophora attinorum]KPI46010.1 Trichodiene oxygenase [Phialophora attinorum]
METDKDFQLRLLGYVPLAYAIFFLLRSIYRLYLHPLARYPGPRLAAATLWYQVYFEVFLVGRFSQQLDRLHDQYGPIVRIGPNEVHIKDPEFFDQLFNFSPDFNKPWAAPDDIARTQSFDLHKVRRKALEPYFSKKAVLNLESTIREDAEELCQRLLEARSAQKPASITLLARCFTAEIMSEYIFGRPYGFLADPRVSEQFFAAQNSIFQHVYVWQNSRICKLILESLALIPQSWLPEGHEMRVLGAFTSSIEERIKAAKKVGRKDTASHAKGVLLEDYASLPLPASDQRPRTVFDMALVLFTAGFETTAYTFETAVYHTLANTNVHERLLAELSNACPNAQDMPTWLELEKLPYLSAVISESLRLSIGQMLRISRRNMKEDMTYKQWVIPKGTIIGMSTRHIHYDKGIFPDPDRFDPERWLKGEESKHLHKYLVSFSKGARRCMGMNVAYAELYIAIATLFRRFQFELYETTRKDIDPVLDFLIPLPEKGSNGVRVLVK